MSKSSIKEREKAKKNFEKLSLVDRVRTNKEYNRICSPFPIKGKVVGRETISVLEEDVNTIPYLITVETKSGRVIEVNALWLEKVG